MIIFFFRRCWDDHFFSVGGEMIIFFPSVVRWSFFSCRCWDDHFFPVGVEMIIFFPSVLRWPFFSRRCWDDHFFSVGVGMTIFSRLSASKMQCSGHDLSRLPTCSTQRAMQILQTIYGSGIPQPTGVFRTSWSLDPNFLMSFSDWPIFFTRQDYATMCAPVLDRLFISGEACSPDFFGFTHGAYFEGVRAAEEVLQVWVFSFCTCSATECVFWAYFNAIFLHIFVFFVLFFHTSGIFQRVFAIFPTCAMTSTH